MIVRRGGLLHCITPQYSTTPHRYYVGGAAVQTTILTISALPVVYNSTHDTLSTLLKKIDKQFYYRYVNCRCSTLERGSDVH